MSKKRGLSRLYQRDVEKLLTAWGNQSNHQLIHHLGWQRQSLLELVRHLGIVPQRSRRGPHQQWIDDEVNSLISVVEELLQALPQEMAKRRSPKVARVLVYHFTHDGTLATKAKALGLPKTTYDNYRREGLAWMRRQLTEVLPTMYGRSH